MFAFWTTEVIIDDHQLMSSGQYVGTLDRITVEVDSSGAVCAVQFATGGDFIPLYGPRATPDTLTHRIASDIERDCAEYILDRVADARIGDRMAAEEHAYEFQLGL